MHLGSPSGAALRLMIDGYEYPGIQPSTDDDWDANWLVVAGTARVNDALNWSFRDPSLTTWDVHMLVDWLRRVAAGEMPTARVPHTHATPQELTEPPVWPPAHSNEDAGTESEDFTEFTDDLQDAGWLVFIEPNLSFGVEYYRDDRVGLMIGFGAESSPPPVDPQEPGWFNLRLDVSRRDCEVAATDLAEQLTAFPAR